MASLKTFLANAEHGDACAEPGREWGLQDGIQCPTVVCGPKGEAGEETSAEYPVPSLAYERESGKTALAMVQFVSISAFSNSYVHEYIEDNVCEFGRQAGPQRAEVARGLLRLVDLD